MKYLELFWIFLKLGCTSFGGPVAHLIYFRASFVEQKKWLSEQDYSSIVALCQTLPGPASSQVGFSIGLLRAGLLGAIIAFIAFTLPSVILLIVFANYLFMFSGDFGQAVLHALVIVAFAVVSHGVLSMGKQLCSGKIRFCFAVLSFSIVLLLNTALAQITAIALCMLLGLVLISKPVSLESKHEDLSSSSQHKIAPLSSFIAIILFCLLFIFLPHIQTAASDFYRAGALVFGGGHVVLPLLESSFVGDDYVTQSQFLAGYGATQALPGPMFSFAAYLGYLMPEQGGIAGAIIATVLIFLPGFLLLIAVLPHWQRLQSIARLQGAIAGANAAVVGLLMAALYDPIFKHAIVSAYDLIIAAIAYGAISRFNAPILWVVLFCVVSKAIV